MANKLHICKWIIFVISTFANIEEMATGKLLIQDGKEISLLKSDAVKKQKKKNSQGL